MKASICAHIEYSNQYSAPALYWSERKRLQVPAALNGYDASYRYVHGEVDPDEWLDRAASEREQVYLEFTPKDIVSWEWYQSLAFEDALVLYEAQRKREEQQKRQERSAAIIHAAVALIFRRIGFGEFKRTVRENA